jgi:hypothetical protein
VRFARLADLVALLIATAGLALLTWDAIESLRITDAQIAAGAPEDTLGFGLFPTLVLLAGPTLLALLWLWRRATGRGQRIVAIVTTALFVASLAFNVWAYNLLRARVLK